MSKESTIKQKIIELLDRAHSLCDRYQQFLTKFYSSNLRMKNDIDHMKRCNDQLSKMVKNRFDHQEIVLSETRRIAAASEETLLNVLLAIRQNEFLQAYYPAQHGYPDIKVTGSHPARLSGKGNEI